MTSERKREWYTLGLLLAISLLFRVLISGVDRVIWGDEPFYLWLGRNWLTGQGYTFTGQWDVHHTPLYPLLTGLFYLVVRDLALSSRICYILFGAALSLPIYGIAKEMYGRRVGYASAALVAFWPALTAAVLFWGTMTEPPYYFFVYSGLYLALLLVRGKGSLWTCFLAGMAFALAYLTRPEAIAYVAVAGVILALVQLWERRLWSRHALTGLALYALGFLALFVPYAYYTYQHTGAWMISQKAGVTFITCIGLSAGDVGAFDRATWGLDNTGLEVYFFSTESHTVSMLGYIRAFPREFALLVYQNVVQFINSVISFRLFPYFLFPFVGLAWLKRAWDRQRAKGELLLLASLTPVMGFLLFFIQDRYIATLLPTLLIWLGLGLVETGDWLVETWDNLVDGPGLRGFWRAILGALPVLVVLLYCAVMIPRLMASTSRGSFRTAHKTMGLWLAQEGVRAEDVIMSRYPALAFHAGSRWVPTPNAAYDEIMRYAQHKGANYFIVDERETKGMRPQLAFLIQGSNVPSELELVHLVESEGERLAVYRISQEGP